MQYILELLDSTDSHLADLHDACDQADVRSKNPTLAGEVRLLVKRLMSRMIMLGDKLAPGNTRTSDTHRAIVERYRNEQQDRCCLTLEGDVLFADGAGGDWRVMETGFTSDYFERWRAHTGQKWTKMSFQSAHPGF